MLYTVTCRGCEDVFTFSLNVEAVKAWQNGVHVQQAFPELSDDERELMISNTCGKCWEEMAMSVLDPESDYPEYASDYYVDRDCD